MDDAWLDDYIAAWVDHPVAGSPHGAQALAHFLSFLSPTIRYRDVPTGLVFVGHGEVESMCQGAYQWCADLTSDVLTRQTNGSLFAFETVTSGTNTGPMGELPATGLPFSFKSVSVGRVGTDGLVEEHRDYWDLSTMLNQVGLA
jgi:hypothetical protein